MERIHGRGREWEEFSQMEMICGNGAACEKTCPIMRPGQPCPGVAEVMQWCRDNHVSIVDLFTPQAVA